MDKGLGAQIALGTGAMEKGHGQLSQKDLTFLQQSTLN